jgi:hypothetical protein
MADLKDRVAKGLSEVRTTILGVQIFLGFQYEALFQQRFGALPQLDKALSLGAFALLLVAVTAMIAPVSFHQLAEDGQATRLQESFTKVAMSFALGAFTVAIALTVYVTLQVALGEVAALMSAVMAMAAAIFFWFGIEMIMKRPPTPPTLGDQGVDLKERISQMMTETRIVLPGVQALLGFQYAAYLTVPFGSLAQKGRLAHTAALFLLLGSMILLMAPAPFHRIAENGEDTERACKVGVGLTLAGLALLGLALACDVFVAVLVDTGAETFAGVASAGAAVTLLAVWFALPALIRHGRRRPSLSSPR